MRLSLSSGNSPLDKLKSVISAEFPFIWNILKWSHKQQILEHDITKYGKKRKMWLQSNFPAALNSDLKKKKLETQTKV